MFFITDVYKSGRNCISCHNWSTAVWYKNYWNNLEDVVGEEKTVIEWRKEAEQPNELALFFVCRDADVIPLTVPETGLSELEAYELGSVA